MSATGLVRTPPVLHAMEEVVLNCGDFGIHKPLDECNSKELGSIGEELCAQYLESVGLEVLERNWKCSYGEVDIVCEDDGTLVLVEVKTRKALLNNSLAPELAVGYRKQNRYQKLALIYLAKHSRLPSVRFDVCAVMLGEQGTARLRHYAGAFEWDD